MLRYQYNMCYHVVGGRMCFAASRRKPETPQTLITKEIRAPDPN